MPSVKEYFMKMNNFSFGIILYILIGISMLLNYWLVRKGIDAGATYLEMTLTSTVIFIFAYFLFKDKENYHLSKMIKLPFTTSTTLGAFSLLFGMIIAVIFQVILTTFSSYSISSFSIPLLSNSINQGFASSFTVAQLSEKMSGKLFIYMFDAGVVEEMSFLGLFLFLSVVIYFAYKLVKKEEPSPNWVIFPAIALCSIIFAFAHSLNATYTGLVMFIVAGAFRFVSLITIYYLGIFLLFWVGYHMINNLFYLVAIEGFSAVLNGFVSWFGVFFIGFILLLLWFIMNNFGKFKDDVAKYVTSSPR